MNNHQQMIDVIKLLKQSKEKIELYLKRDAEYVGGLATQFLLPELEQKISELETSIKAEEPKKTWYVNRYKTIGNFTIWSKKEYADLTDGNRTDCVEVQAATAKEAERIAKEMPWPEEPFLFEGKPLNVGDKLWKIRVGSNDLFPVKVVSIRPRELYPIVIEYASGSQDEFRADGGWATFNSPNRITRTKPAPKMRNLRPEELPSVFIVKSDQGNRQLAYDFSSHAMDYWIREGSTWSPLMPTRAQEDFRPFVKEVEDV